jgi:acyl transferase domain-containing protein
LPFRRPPSQNQLLRIEIMPLEIPRIEPVAIVGVGCVHPRAAGIDALRRLLAEGRPEFTPYPVDRFWRASEPARAGLSNWRGAFFDDVGVDPRSFRIPKVYERAVSTMTLLLLQAARDCIINAGYGADGAALPKEAVDVIVGVCFGFDATLTNALKVHGLYWLEGREPSEVEAGREALRNHFGCSSHDRLGEMASSIAARIGSAYGCHGRIIAVENADATGYSAIRTAMLSLAERQSDAVLVATGQRLESVLAPLALNAKGFVGDASIGGLPLGEGVTALLLKRLGDAQRGGDHIRAVIAGLGARRVDSPELRYTWNARLAREAATEACAAAGLRLDDIGAVECVLPGLDGEAEELAAAFPKRTFTRAAALLGHGFSNAGTAAVAATALALGDDHAATPGGPIAVVGASITGLTWALLMRRPDLSTPFERPPAEAAAPEPIAVVGMGGCFGPTLGRAAFWNALLAGDDGVRKVSDSVLPRAIALKGAAGQALTSYAEYGGELAAEWERRFFNAKRLRLFPKRVAALDVAHKLALTVAAEALDDFGFHDREQSKLGKGLVIVASPLCLARERALSNRLHAPELAAVLGHDRARVVDAERAVAEINHLTLDGVLASNIAALISGCFRLAAESMAVEAACASSLAAVQVGIQALRRGYADWVVAGGVELPVNMRDLILCSSQSMLTKEKIAPFALGADGFSPGDGAGMFVLRRLRDAQRDGDAIYGSIVGVGASSDAASMTAPDPQGQARAMRRALAEGQVPPDSVGYVEAHGTGTRIGDGVEIAALSAVYGGGERKEPLLIGSVKSNIGHAFAAAGAAGLMKALLALDSATVPPTLLRRDLNPELPLEAIPAAIIAHPRPWPASKGPRRAAVNSMGTGGINFHLLVESA